MRITMVTEAFYPAVDGTTTTLRNVADQLIDAGHQLSMIAPGPGLSSYRNAAVARIDTLDRPGRQVRAALEAFAPDLVHVTSPGRIGRRALKHAAKLTIPSLVVQHAPVPRVTAELWQRRVGAVADRVLATAQWNADALTGLGVKAPVWRPGVDTRLFHPRLRDADLHAKWAKASSASGPKVVVGYAGSLHRRHGVRDLQQLAGLPGIRLVIIGAGPQRGWLESRLPGAKFTGALETTDLARAMAALDVLVHPGQQETCCHAIHEAGASGVPVVAPRAGGAPEAVTSLDNGLLYDPEDARGLRRAVESVAGDRHRQLLGGAGRERAERRDWGVATHELLAHYDALRRSVDKNQ